MNRKPVDYLFEVSWEVCNKVGGINTVIKSKIPEMQRYYRDGYFLIGPYFQEKIVTEFQERIPPEPFLRTFEKLKKVGIVCHYGKWLISSSQYGYEPNTILIDFSGYVSNRNEIKTKFWEVFRIDSLNSDYHDYDEPIIWSTCFGVFLEEFLKQKKLRNCKVLAHFHEWLSCGGLLYIKMKNLKVATVFTTHATVLGRTLAGNNVDLYNKLPELNPDEEAYRWYVHTKHQTEKVAAHVADVFTTVSEITAIESKYILGKEPDIIVYNGLNASKFPSIEEFSIRHRVNKEKIKEFLKYYFFPYYSFDLENTLFYFTTGRYEFHNKGFDILIEALGLLNKKLKDEKSKLTIVVFFWVPAATIRIKPELAISKVYYEDMKEMIDEHLEEIKQKLIFLLLSKKRITEKSLLGDEILMETKKKIKRFLREGNPALCTHDLVNEAIDPILQHCKKHGLLNREEDRVKVVFYPVYLHGLDGLLDLNYDDAVMGCHLGIFPSYYEPWGYTPAETASLGVASVTTDYSGFARYIRNTGDVKGDKGIFVIEMFNKTHEEKVRNLFECLYRYSKFSKKGRIENKIEAQRIAFLIDWKILIKNYIAAHELAVKRVYG